VGVMGAPQELNRDSLNQPLGSGSANKYKRSVEVFRDINSQSSRHLNGGKDVSAVHGHADSHHASRKHIRRSNIGGQDSVSSIQSANRKHAHIHQRQNPNVDTDDRDSSDLTLSVSKSAAVEIIVIIDAAILYHVDDSRVGGASPENTFGFLGDNLATIVIAVACIAATILVLILCIILTARLCSRSQYPPTEQVREKNTHTVRHTHK